MRKALRSKSYPYYCNVIRAKYQAKRVERYRIAKHSRRHNKSKNVFGYKTLKLNKDDIKKIIKDAMSLTDNHGSSVINFKKLIDFDLGLCLIFVCLLEHFKSKKDIDFAFNKRLMPKNKTIQSHLWHIHKK